MGAGWVHGRRSAVRLAASASARYRRRSFLCCSIVSCNKHINHIELQQHSNRLGGGKWTTIFLLKNKPPEATQYSGCNVCTRLRVDHHREHTHTTRHKIRPCHRITVRGGRIYSRSNIYRSKVLTRPSPCQKLSKRARRAVRACSASCRRISAGTIDSARPAECRSRRPGRPTAMAAVAVLS